MSQAMEVVAPTTNDASGDQVQNATFVTRCIPDISPAAVIMGICTIPMGAKFDSSLAWYLADFLAFKSLLRGYSDHSRKQWWAARDGVVDTVKDFSDILGHGNERRVVDQALQASPGKSDKVCGLKDDEIESEFLKCVTKMSNSARAWKLPLVIIMCGPTTLEQDIFFDYNSERPLSSTRIKEAIGSPDADVMCITPAMFSAGWQVNPAFNRPIRMGANADKIDFLAIQTGALFGTQLQNHFLGWSNPALDIGRVELKHLRDISDPLPLRPSESTNILTKALSTKIYALLVARLAMRPDDHSFSFSAEDDDWEHLFGPRKYRSLEAYGEEWRTLTTIAVVDGIRTEIPFMGNAFGGTIASQVRHLKYLATQAVLAYPNVWTTGFDKYVGKEMEKFANNPNPDDMTCHAMFSIVENRCSTILLGSLIVETLGLSKPSSVGCRDWSQEKWWDELSDQEKRKVLALFSRLKNIVPTVATPEQTQFDKLSKAARPMDQWAYYVAAAVLSAPEEDHAFLLERTITLLELVKRRQFERLMGDPELRLLCTSWVRSIDMPPAAVFKPGELHQNSFTNIAAVSDAIEQTVQLIPSHSPSDSGLPTAIYQHPDPVSATTQYIESLFARKGDLKWLMRYHSERSVLVEELKGLWVRLRDLQKYVSETTRTVRTSKERDEAMNSLKEMSRGI